LPEQDSYGVVVTITLIGGKQKTKEEADFIAQVFSDGADVFLRDGEFNSSKVLVERITRV
jgi:hypothetical protein